MTRSKINSRRGLLILLAAGLSLSASAASRADVDVDWVHEGLYQFRITNVPDFDQLRSTLPNNGSCYCAPTSAVNWAAYFANHGLPDLPPGPGYWGAPFMYEAETNAIWSMGLVMLTDPFGGTGKDSKHFGLRIWLGMAGDHFTVTSFYSDYDWSPTVHFMNLNIMMGAYVIPSVGWYLEPSDTTFILRDGGHAVSVAAGARDGVLFRFGIRDPSSDEDDLTRQSPFTTDFYLVEHRFACPLIWGENRLMSRFPGYGGGGKIGYLDGFTVIHPMFVLTTHPTQPGMIVKRRVPDLYGMAVPVVQEWETPDMMSVKSMAIHVDLSSFVYVTEGDPAQVWRLDPVSGESELIQFPFDNPREVMVGRLRDLYVLDGDDLVRIAIDVKPPRLEGRLTPPSAMCAMAYDDDTDELMLLAPGDQSIHRYLYHFDCDPEVKHIEPEIPLSEKASICWDATREAIWVASDASNSVFMLVDTGQQLQSHEYFHPVLIDPVDKIDAHDGGHIFVSCGGMLYEFELVGKGLELVDDPLFPEMQVGEHLCISRSSTNYDEDLHGGEEWRDVPPDTFAEPTEDCPADLDGNGTVNTSDLLALLAAWGECPQDEFCHADFDYSGDVGVADLLTLLAAWGPCEPIGACCLWDGNCADMTANDCALQTGSIWFADESCDTFQCPDWPTGACCVDSDCVATNTKYECDLLGGRWSEGETCDNWYCPDEYCDGWGSCGQYINRVRMGEVDNSSGCDTGYSDHTGLAAQVIPGYVLPIVVNTADYQPDDICGIWVDWDQDFIFDYPRDFVDSGDLGAGFWLTQIGAPPDAKPGPTRMRIRLQNGAPLDPCDGPEPGEVEDYTIVVVDDSPYCAAWAECDPYISRVQVGEIDNSSGCQTGYSDYTHLSTEISLDGGTDITITVGNSAGYEYGAVFIDWNQDGVLGYPSEEVELEGSPGPGPYTATIVPPPDAVLGPTRMRIRVSGEEDPPGPCGGTDTGEVEDYTIVVIE